jgi:chromosome transmission fidelity protein 4
LRETWENQKAFKNGHTTDLTAAAWSPNGALLATSSIDRKLVLWDAKTQKLLTTYDTPATILAMQWHPTKNILSYTNNDGELYIHADFVPETSLPLLRTAAQKPPLLRDSIFGGDVAPTAALPERQRRGSSTSMLDAILGSDAESGAGSDDGEDEGGFIIDDDGAGYAELNGNGKRPGHDDAPNGVAKRMRGPTTAWRPKMHAPFQPGSTSWQGKRRYLCLNLVGFVWTVDQDDHHTVTVEFYDREFQRDFHFTDPWMYDKACLNEHGTLFACPPRLDDGEPAHIFYRPHETWTARAEWRTRLPRGESVTALALSAKYVVACTSAGYVRVYSLFGVPVRIHRQKAAPAVACAAHGDVVMTLGNGAVGADGKTRLVYTLEDVARDITHQSEDIVALPPQGGAVKSVFFSDAGDPCVFDDTGVLLVLVHWRRTGQARWVPLLDAAHVKIPGADSAAGRLWPVAVAQGRFHAIVLRPGEERPYFPRPLVADFAFAVPLTAPGGGAGKRDKEDGDEAMDGAGATTADALEHAYVLHSALAALLADASAEGPAAASALSAEETRLELGRCELEADKALLQLVAGECRAGEERGMKALELAGLMRNRNGRMLEAARKVAVRYGRDRLAERIAEMEEERLMAGEM